MISNVSCPTQACWIRTALPVRIPNPPTSPTESFGDILSQYEQSHSHKPEEGGKGLEGTVIAVSGESVFLDIGYKIEGIIPLAEFQSAGETVKPGDKLPVSIKGRDPGRLLRAVAPQGGAAQGLVVAGEGVRRQSAPSRRDHGGGEGRVERGRGRARLHAGFAQRRQGRGRDGEAGRPGDPLPHHQAGRGRRRRGGGPPRGAGRGRARRQGAPLHRSQGRRDGARHGAQPDRLRRLRGHRRRGRAAARGRHFLGPRQQAGRRADRGPAGGGQGAEGGCRQAAHLARHEAASAASVGPGGREIQGRRPGARARSRAWPISARSWSWRRASKG